MRRLLGAARARVGAAGQLRSPGENGPAFRLLGEAFAILVSAHLVARGEADGERVLGAASAWQKLEALAETGELARAPTDLEAFLSNEDVLAADRLEPREALRLRPQLEALLRQLAGALEVRSVRRIKVNRALRMVAVAAGLLTLLVATVAWALAPANVARGKPVTTSSIFPRTPDPAGATDGVRGRGFGVHTTFEHLPWVIIDLGKSYKLSEVVVYHRSDNHQLETLPLTLQLSQDGASYSEISTRSTLFTAEEPWHQKLDGKPARYVRLIVNKKEKGYIALSEIEVYGR